MIYYDPITGNHFDDSKPSEEKRYFTIKLELDRKHDADLIDILQNKKDVTSYIVIVDSKSFNEMKAKWNEETVKQRWMRL